MPVQNLAVGFVRDLITKGGGIAAGIFFAAYLNSVFVWTNAGGEPLMYRSSTEILKPRTQKTSHFIQAHTKFWMGYMSVYLFIYLLFLLF